MRKGSPRFCTSTVSKTDMVNSKKGGIVFAHIEDGHSYLRTSTQAMLCKTQAVDYTGGKAAATYWHADADRV